MTDMKISTRLAKRPLMRLVISAATKMPTDSTICCWKVIGVMISAGRIASATSQPMMRTGSRRRSAGAGRGGGGTIMC